MPVRAGAGLVCQKILEVEQQRYSVVYENVCFAQKHWID